MSLLITQNSTESSFWDSCDLLGSLAWTKILLLGKTPHFGRWGKHQNKINKKNSLFLAWMTNKTHIIVWHYQLHVSPPNSCKYLVRHLPFSLSQISLTAPLTSLILSNDHILLILFIPDRSWRPPSVASGPNRREKSCQRKGFEFQVASVFLIPDHIRICPNIYNKENYILSWCKNRFIETKVKNGLRT